jgi:hypothetical protein
LASPDVLAAFGGASTTRDPGKAGTATSLFFTRIEILRFDAS